jgi:hypothetical protein
VLRVGITGARDLAPEQMQRLREQVTFVLRVVRRGMERLADTSEAREAYRREANGAVQPALRFLSPLAEGADRLAAEVACELGYELVVPMPFARGEYEKDFVRTPAPPPQPSPAQSVGEGESCAAFCHLLAQAASTIELDGGRDDPTQDLYDEARSYEAVGRFVVRNCDLLIAIWNGKPGNGRGGAADTVQFAADFGPPVWWIHAERDQAPIWIADGRDLRDPKPDGSAERALHTHLKRLILPPRPSLSPGHERSLMERIAGLGHTPRSPLAAWYAETPLKQRRWTAAHRVLMRLAARGYKPSYPPSRTPEDPVARAWHDAYEAPDGRANEYAARYRSVYVLVFLLAALALIGAAVSLAAAEPATPSDWFPRYHWHVITFVATSIELLALLLILGLVVANIRHQWHRRWIDYRLLAELYRKQQALAVLGWSLSGRAVRALIEQPGEVGEDQASWVVWLFAAMLRAAPVPHGTFNKAELQRAREIVQRDLVAEQLAYHAGRRTQCERAGHSFVVVGEVLFLLIIGFVGMKLWLLATEQGEWLGACLGLAAAAVPALAAASVGVRAYAELEMLAEQSRRMHAAMETGRRRIETVDLDRPLASQELGAEVLEVATLMLQDVDGWARLFRVKLVEAG